MRLLVVEDDDSLRATLDLGLRAAGFEVMTAGDARSGTELSKRVTPDIAILDVNLPDESGFALCARFKERGILVILLTARTALDDRLHGFELGADDYVGKPFALKELVARIHAVSRRQDRTATRRLGIGTVAVDLEALHAERAGHPLDLTRREMDLLIYLLRNAGRVLSRDQILSHVWGYDSEVGEGVVDVYVSYLRRKLETFGPNMIDTVRGVGYRLRDDAP